MKLTHRILELDNGFFTAERYVPWFFFGIEIARWKRYRHFTYEFGYYDTIQFNTQANTLRWMRERFGDDNVTVDYIGVVLGVK